MIEVSTRPPAVAGMFYPASKPALAHTVESLFADAAPLRGAASVPKALIVPHAGYMYSGPIAASAYACLAPVRATIRRVILLGPSHYVALHGLAVPLAAAFSTPLGSVPIDQELVQRVSQLRQVVSSDEAHAAEHALEVQLPFLQLALDAFTVLPLAVGRATEDEVAEVIELVWGGPETLIVVSSDLSHYHSYHSAQLLDRETANQIVSLASLADFDQACGAVPVNGLLACARRRDLSAHLLDLRNSGDTAGDKSRVVGYGAFAFSEEQDHDR